LHSIREHGEQEMPFQSLDRGSRRDLPREPVTPTNGRPELAGFAFFSASTAQVSLKSVPSRTATWTRKSYGCQSTINASESSGRSTRWMQLAPAGFLGQADPIMEHWSG
jgi:hypothetical protein